MVLEKLPLPVSPVSGTLIDARRVSVPVPPSSPPVSSPVRYRLVTHMGVRMISSVSSPNVFLRVAPGLVVKRRGLRQFDRQTIFLDGAYGGSPFHDNARRQYSLDHHAGVLRSITLSTCEQAAVVIVHGIPMHEGTWTVVLNDADLDSVLAAWVLINYLDLLRDDMRLLVLVMPLLRLEGVIDSHGLGKEVLAGLSPEALNTEKQRIEQLRKSLQEYSANKGEQRVSLEQAVIKGLKTIDRLLLPAELIAELSEFEEVEHARLRGDRFAILCRSQRGIYEVEGYLRRRYGEMLGIVLLERAANQYTVRLSDSFLERDLSPLYARLNRKDANATSNGDEENQWGGSDEIGGSPRATGSALSGPQILEQIRQLYGEPIAWWLVLWRMLLAPFSRVGQLFLINRPPDNKPGQGNT